MANIPNEEIISEINKIREKGNFQTVKKKIGENRLREFIKMIYPRFSVTEIEAITGLPDSTLGHWFNRLNIPFVRSHISNVSIAGRQNSKVIIEEGGRAYKMTTVKITPELSYLIGFSLGDGSVQKYMVEVFNKDRRLRNYLYEIMKQFGKITEDERKNGLWRLRLSSGVIAGLIRNEKQINEATLNFIFNSDTLAKKFVAAFWDAEGSVLKGKNYYHIYLYNTNNLILDRICKFLENKRIEFSIFNLKSRTEEYFFEGRIVRSKKKLQRINIPKSSRLKWIEEIGVHLRHGKKSEVIKEILEFGGKK